MDPRVQVVLTEQNKIKDLVNLITRVQQVFRDTDVPLEERWEGFTAMARVGLLPIEFFGTGRLELLDQTFSLADDFRVLRHTTMTFQQLYNLLKGREATDLDIWRQEIMNAGYGSFTFDW